MFSDSSWTNTDGQRCGAAVHRRDARRHARRAPRDRDDVQLLYLRFAPRGSTAFAAMKAGVDDVQPVGEPPGLFNQTLAAGGNHPRRQPESAERWRNGDPTNPCVLSGTLLDAGNFTLIFVGSFTLDMINRSSNLRRKPAATR